MKLFNDFDVYTHKYTYDEMKVMCVITCICQDGPCKLDYEDIMCICEAVYAHWVDGIDKNENEKYAKYPWLELQGNEEEGYIQAYAQRVLPEFIKLYLEEFTNG
jgi:hypothetical protein